MDRIWEDKDSGGVMVLGWERVVLRDGKGNRKGIQGQGEEERGEWWEGIRERGRKEERRGRGSEEVRVGFLNIASLGNIKIESSGKN